MNGRLALVVLFVCSVAACGGKKKQEGPEPPDPVSVPTGSGSGSAGDKAAADKAALVERGDYLAGLLGCGFCHVGVGPNGPDPSRAFAGGLEIPEKFGTWRSPNITQDEKTGIGKWTDDQIMAAIRTGVRPDSSQLFPVMPYLNYNRMTDADAKALVAFLRTVKPIDNAVERNTNLKLPQIKPPDPTNAPDPTDDPMKHGEYLVTVMHCGMCHTPMGPKGPEMTKQFAGGMEFEIPFLGTGKVYASNITSDPDTGIGKWSGADIAKVMRTMTRPDGTLIQGPMALYLGGWSKLTDADLSAIVTFVKAIPPVKNKVAKSTFKPNVMPAGGAGSAAGSGSAAAPAAGSGSAK